jgi:uncharacterized membrane protein YqjE
MKNKNFKEQIKENVVPVQAVMAFVLVFFLIVLAWLSFMAFGLLAWWNDSTLAIISLIIGLILSISGGVWAYRRTIRHYFGKVE